MNKNKSKTKNDYALISKKNQTEGAIQNLFCPLNRNQMTFFSISFQQYNCTFILYLWAKFYGKNIWDFFFFFCYFFGRKVDVAKFQMVFWQPFWNRTSDFRFLLHHFSFLFFVFFVFLFCFLSTLTVIWISTLNLFGKICFWCWVHMDPSLDHQREYGRPWPLK